VWGQTYDPNGALYVDQVNSSGTPIVPGDVNVIKVAGTPIAAQPAAGVLPVGGARTITLADGATNAPTDYQGAVGGYTYAFNGTTTWDRLRSDNTGALRSSLYAKGTVAGDTALLTGPAADGTSNGTLGVNTVLAGPSTNRMQASADNIAAGNSGARVAAVHPILFNGTNYDPLRGDNAGAARSSLYAKSTVAGDTSLEVVPFNAVPANSRFALVTTTALNQYDNTLAAETSINSPRIGDAASGANFLAGAGFGYNNTAWDRLRTSTVGIGQLITAPPDYAFLNIAAGQATTTVKSGAGFLHTLCFNSAAVATNTTTIYDNTAASGTVIAIPAATTATVPTCMAYDLKFSTGLTIITATANGANMTVSYR